MTKRCKCDYEIINNKIYIHRYCPTHSINSIIGKQNINSIVFKNMVSCVDNLLQNIPSKIEELYFCGDTFFKYKLVFPQYTKILILNINYPHPIDNLPQNLETFIFKNNDVFSPWNKNINDLPLSLRTLVFDVRGYKHSFDLLPPNLENFLLLIDNDGRFGNYDFTKLSNLPSSIKLFGLNCDYCHDICDCTQFKYFPPRLEKFVTNFYCNFCWNTLPHSIKYLYICINGVNFISPKKIKKHFLNITEQSKNTQLQNIVYIDYNSPFVDSQFIFSKYGDTWKKHKNRSYGESVKFVDKIGFGENIARFLLR
jgi:hypothetical protein